MSNNSDAVSSCVTVVVLVGLKLWALAWLYTFMAAWIATGVVPGFWRFVWAVVLVIFILPTPSSSKEAK